MSEEFAELARSYRQRVMSMQTTLEYAESIFRTAHLEETRKEAEYGIKYLAGLQKICRRLAKWYNAPEVQEALVNPETLPESTVRLRADMEKHLAKIGDAAYEDSLESFVMPDEAREKIRKEPELAIGIRLIVADSRDKLLSAMHYNPERMKGEPGVN
jgi:hypothetical protein